MENNQIQVGRSVAGFKAEALLPDGSFKTIDLSDYRGRWLIVFSRPSSLRRLP